MCSCEEFSLLNIKIGQFNISKVIVAYFIGYLISPEIGQIVAIDIMITEFFRTSIDENKNCSCKNNIN